MYACQPSMLGLPAMSLFNVYLFIYLSINLFVPGAENGPVRLDAQSNRRRGQNKATGKSLSPTAIASATATARRGRSIAPNGNEGARPSTMADNITMPVVGASSRISSVDARLVGTVRPVHGSRTGLETLVTWDWPLSSPDQDNDDEEDDEGGGGGRRQLQRTSSMFVFTVHWARRTCNVDERFPYCDDPDTYYSNTVYSTSRRVSLQSTVFEERSHRQQCAVTSSIEFQVKNPSLVFRIETRYSIDQHITG